MDFNIYLEAALSQLVFFVVWSAAVYAIVLLITKISEPLQDWSRLWQASLIVALISLLPSSFFQVNQSIPAILLDSFSTSSEQLLNHQQLVAAKIESVAVMQVFLSLVLLMIIGGSCLSLSRFCFSVYQVRKLIAQATPHSGLGLLTEQQIGKMTANNVGLFITKQPISPFVFTLFRHHIVLPEQVFTMPAQQRKLLIEHELTHLQRLDSIAVLLFRLLSSVFWFNPFVQLMEKRFLRSMELNCDKAVIAAHPQEKLTYAQALITSLKFSQPKLVTGIGPYFSGSGFNKQDYQRRIKAALAKDISCHYGKRYKLILLLLTSVFSLMTYAAKPFFTLSGLETVHADGILPVAKSSISSGFEDISDFRGRRPHRGIDFAAPVGTPVVASFAGKVVIADDISLHKNYGKVILIEHEDQKKTLYAHLDSFAVSPGQYVSAGQQVGSVGISGRVTGAHLHFELLQHNKHQDPSQYLNLANVNNK